VKAELGNELTPTQVKDQPSVGWNAEPYSFYSLCLTGVYIAELIAIHKSVDIFFYCYLLRSGCRKIKGISPLVGRKHTRCRCEHGRDTNCVCWFCNSTKNR